MPPVLISFPAAWWWTDAATTSSAEGYMNRYRNGWSASSAATKQFVDEQVRRRGKPKDGVPAIPLAELPVPIPLSRFQWPLVRPCLPHGLFCDAAPANFC